MLKEHDILQDAMALYCDNVSVINILKNSVQQSRTKHIDICHQFIRDLVENKQIVLEHVPTESQIVDICTEALDVVYFEALRAALALCKINL